MRSQNIGHGLPKKENPITKNYHITDISIFNLLSFLFIIKYINNQ